MVGTVRRDGVSSWRDVSPPPGNGSEPVPALRVVKGIPKMEALYLLTLFCGIGGAVWTAIIAFKMGDMLWAIGCVLLSGIVAPIYGLMNFEICRIPAILCIAGFGLRILLRFIGADSAA